jgi:hypothetical protein
MLTLQELVQLDSDNRDAMVLSVYLPRIDPDPARRSVRLTRLEAEVSRIAHSLGDAPRAQRMAFDSAVAHVMQTLGDRAGDGSALLTFVTEDGPLFAGRALAPVAQVVRWGRGLLLAPYLRSLKHEHPVFVVAIDRKHARLFRYQGGEAAMLETFEAAVSDHPPEHMGDAARPKFHPGVRGTTGTDAALRRDVVAFERMAGQLIRRLESEREHEPWIVVGGMPSSVRELLVALPRQLEARSTSVSALSPLSTLPEIAQMASVAASELTARRDEAWVESIFEQASGLGRSVRGVEAVHRALEAKSAHLLLISVSMVDRDPSSADTLVRAALDGGTTIEVVSGGGASRLDADCDGVAAQLRYVPAPAVATLGPVSAAAGL